jgi:hypothetical protein
VTTLTTVSFVLWWPHFIAMVILPASRTGVNSATMSLLQVGFGDRTPWTNTEKVFSIFAELAGSIIFGIIAGSMGALAMSTKMSEREMKFERERLDEFLKLKRINKDLRRKVTEQMDNW